MPLEGDSRFKDMKKAFANGIELKGKTIGIIGIGRIGKATAKIALGNGMKVIAYDPHIESVDLDFDFYNGESVNFTIDTISKEEVLQQSDFITLHVPAHKEYVIGTEEFKLMKQGTMLVNAARGGVVDEIALVKAIEDGIIFHAALDVFEKEPSPEIQLLMNPALSLSPHIGAATAEAQERIGEELAQQIISILG
jgi:D-3-phosphoglycerate dehydrogenase